MTPPRRESALESVDVTGTDIVGQSFRPNSHHRRRDYAKIREGARELQRHECLPRGYPAARTAETTYQHRTMAPAAKRHRDHRPEPPLWKPRSQPNPPPSGARAARTQQAHPTAARTHHQHPQPPSPALPAVGKPAPHRSAKTGEVYAQEQHRGLPWLQIDPLVRSGRRSTHGQISRRAAAFQLRPTRGQQQRETAPAWTKTSERRCQEAQNRGRSLRREKKESGGCRKEAEGGGEGSPPPQADRRPPAAAARPGAVGGGAKAEDLIAPRVAQVRTTRGSVPPLPGKNTIDIPVDGVVSLVPGRRG